MRKFVSALALLAGALLLAPASATDTLAAELQPMVFLAGSCWRATLPGDQGIDTHCFTPTLGGHFLRDRHRVAPSNYSGETLYRWDAAARQIRFDYYSSEGMLMSGTASAAENGLAFDLNIPSSEGAAIAMRVGWARDGADAYVATTQVRQGEGWRPVPGSPRFQRVGPSPPD